jgi:hypothetical protein
VAANGAAQGRDAVVVGLRPESLELAADGVPARVQVVEELGADAYVFCPPHTWSTYRSTCSSASEPA